MRPLSDKILNLCLALSRILAYYFMTVVARPISHGHIAFAQNLIFAIDSSLTKRHLLISELVCGAAIGEPRRVQSRLLQDSG